MNVRSLLKDDPRFHTAGSGKRVTYRLARSVLQFIADTVGSDSRTLETGAGLSTVLFAVLATDHVCITPSKEEIDRITTYCGEKGIALDDVAFVNDRSEVALPRLRVDELDLVLVDGNHAFPTPFIDYFYAAEWIRVGGRLVVDDTQIWTCRVLRDFLLAEPEWRLERDFHGRTSSFVKVSEGGHLKWWGMQPYVERRSRSSGLAHRLLGPRRLR